MNLRTENKRKGIVFDHKKLVLDLSKVPISTAEKILYNVLKILYLDKKSIQDDGKFEKVTLSSEVTKDMLFWITEIDALYNNINKQVKEWK